ncbi:MAG: response regulator transcription factor [Bacteroidota bacterium]
MITVAVVDDQKAVRDGLRTMINLNQGVTCLASFANAQEALEAIPKLKPDVLLLDIEMPDLSGIECARRLKQLQPSLNIIMLTIHDDPERIQAAFRAGAYGFLTKNSFPSQIIKAIEDVHQGGAPMNPQIARRLVQSLEIPGNQDLSSREQQILKRASEGLSNQATAKALHISPNTVRFHLKNIYRKLEVHSKVEAIQKAIRRGIL